MKNPLISIVVCARRSEKFIRPCLNSILEQDYDNFEVIIVEGGGPKRIAKVLADYANADSRIRLFTGHDKQPEGIGNKKWFGFRQAKGEILGIVDLDNILQKKSLLREVADIFGSKRRVTGVLAGLKHDLRDDPLVRFVSLCGGDPFFSYRSIDFLRNARREVLSSETPVYESVRMDPDNLFLTGGNVFFYSRKAIDLVGGYDQDILTVERIVRQGFKNLFIVKDATKHRAAPSLWALAKKMLFQKDRAFYEKSDDERFSYLPKNRKEAFEFYRNFFFSILIVPNFLYSFVLYARTKDLVSFVFPLLAFSTTLSHGFNFLRNKFT